MNEILNIRIKNVWMELEQCAICKPDLVIGSPFKNSSIETLYLNHLTYFFADLMENIL